MSLTLWEKLRIFSLSKKDTILIKKECSSICFTIRWMLLYIVDCLIFYTNLGKTYRTAQKLGCQCKLSGVLLFVWQTAKRNEISQLCCVPHVLDSLSCTRSTPETSRQFTLSPNLYTAYLETRQICLKRLTSFSWDRLSFNLWWVLWSVSLTSSP